MLVRHVYSAANLAIARSSVAAVRHLGLSDDCLSVFAREGYEMAAIPDELKPTTATDFAPGLMRGAAGGSSVGLLAGLLAMAVPPLGVTVGGAALMGLAGGMVGAWSGALVGSALPNEVEQRFRERMDAGELLIVLDASSHQLPQLDAAMFRAGAVRLEFEQATVMS